MLFKILAYVSITLIEFLLISFLYQYFKSNLSKFNVIRLEKQIVDSNKKSFKLIVDIEKIVKLHLCGTRQMRQSLIHLTISCRFF